MKSIYVLCMYVLCSLKAEQASFVKLESYLGVNFSLPAVSLSLTYQLFHELPFLNRAKGRYARKALFPYLRGPRGVCKVAADCQHRGVEPGQRGVPRDARARNLSRGNW